MFQNIHEIYKEDFISGKRSDYAELYEKIEPQLITTMSEFKGHIDKFIYRYNSSHSVNVYSRVKKVDSFVDKCLLVSRDKSYVNSIWVDDSPVSIFKVIQDLIGVRLICMTHNDIENCILFISYEELLLVEETQLYTAFPDTSPFYDKRLKNLIDNVSYSRKTKFKEIQPVTKESGYEGIHFICKLDHRFDLKRREKTNDIFKIPFEIQIRTLTHHLWADLEHKMVYNHVKKVPTTNLDDSYKQNSQSFVSMSIKHKLATYNLLLQAADRIQNEIILDSYSNTKALFSSQKLKTKIINEESVSISSLKTFFDEALPEEKTICDLISSINSKLLLENSSFIDEISELYELYCSYGFNPLSYNYKDPKEWGQQRIFLLLLNYILVYSADEETFQWYKSKTLSDQTTDKIITPLDVSINIYRNILFHDKLLRMRVMGLDTVHVDVSHFYDIVVPIRLASAYFYKGFFRESVSTLDVVLHSNEIKHFEKINSPELIKKAYRRLGQYLWYSYNKEWGTKPEDLDRIIDALSNSISYSEPNTTEDNRSFSFYICANYYKYCIKSLNYNYEKFKDLVIEKEHLFSGNNIEIPYVRLASILMSVIAKEDKVDIKRRFEQARGVFEENFQASPGDITRLDIKVFNEIETNVMQHFDATL